MKKLSLLATSLMIVCITVRGQSPAPFTEMFCPVDTVWTGATIVVPPSPLRYDILLKEDDIAHNLEKNNNAPLKGGFGALCFMPTTFGPVTTIAGAMSITGLTAGWLSLSLRDNKTGITGDGGGLLKFKVNKNATDNWVVEPQTEGNTTYNYRFFDMDGLGKGVQLNGLHLARQGAGQNGNLVCYDGWVASNASLTTGLYETGNYTLPSGSPQPGLSIPRYQNMGWLLEANATTVEPLRKLYRAGRGDFGGILATSIASATPAALTAIYATQTQPAVLLKYERTSIEDKIFAFKQDNGAYTGRWLLLNDMDVDGSIFPFSFEELLDVQKIALTKGATMFNRLGSILQESATSGLRNFYIAETGGNSEGDAFTAPGTAYSGTLAHHLKWRDADNDGKFADPYGRILKFTLTEAGGIAEVKPYLEGGRTADGRYTFSNPKQLSKTNFSYNPTVGGVAVAQYMVINEEVENNQFNRNPATSTTPEELMQEVYFLDMHKAEPDLSDLRPFAIIPRGAEVQSVFSDGSRWSPLFLSLRYPNVQNETPYQKSVVIAVSNFEEYFANPVNCGWVAPPPGSDTSSPVFIQEIQDQPDDAFRVWPNPARRALYFDKVQDVQLFDIGGRLLKSELKTKELNVFDLSPGTYFLRNAARQFKKIVIQ